MKKKEAGKCMNKCSVPEYRSVHGILPGQEKAGGFIVMFGGEFKDRLCVVSIMLRIEIILCQSSGINILTCR